MVVQVDLLGDVPCHERLGPVARQSKLRACLILQLGVFLTEETPQRLLEVQAEHGEVAFNDPLCCLHDLGDPVRLKADCAKDIRTPLSVGVFAISGVVVEYDVNRNPVRAE